MLYQLSYSRLVLLSIALHSCYLLVLRALPWPAPRGGGGERIRTSEVVRRQIYSLLPLATWVPLQHRSPERTAKPGRTTPAGLMRPALLSCSAGRSPLPSSAFELVSPQPVWSWRRDSNPRPADYKSAALPAELRQPSKRGDASRGPGERQGYLRKKDSCRIKHRADDAGGRPRRGRCRPPPRR